MYAYMLLLLHPPLKVNTKEEVIYPKLPETAQNKTASETQETLQGAQQT